MVDTSAQGSGADAAVCRERLHTVPMRDGARLSVRELVPLRPCGPRVLVGHAMMVDARTLYRPGRPSLVGSLLKAGLCCFVVDARGRGPHDARRPDDFGYDAHVDDVGALIAWLRSYGPGPIALVGHSLFGNASLAQLARHPECIDDPLSPLCAHAALACNMWLPGCEPRRWRRWGKQAALAFGDAVVDVTGRVAARRLRMGTVDEPTRYWRDFRRFWNEDRWASEEGFDYRAGLARVELPALLVVSDGDRWMAHPGDVLRFTAPLPRREVWHLGPTQRRPGLAGLAPDHMGLVVDPRCEPLWQQLGAWLAD